MPKIKFTYLEKKQKTGILYGEFNVFSAIINMCIAI